MKTARRKSFTLIEVVVVIAIMLLTGVIAAVTVRSESISSIMDRTKSDFRSFCSHVRYKAMEMGADRMVVYDPQRTMFYMARPVADQQEAMEYEEGFVIQKEVKWKLPEQFEVAVDDNDPVEVFRFYPDGGASGRWNLNFVCRDNKERYLSIRVGKLTGRVRGTDSAEKDEEEEE